MSAARFDRRWIVFAFCVAYSAFTFGLISTGFSFWIAPWAQDFKAPRSVIMTAFTASNLMLVLVGPLVGRALDFISIRTALVCGAVVMAAGLALTTLAHQFWLLLVIFGVVVPLGGAFVGTLPATVIGVRMFPERAGLINGLIALGMGLSGAIMAAFATALIDPLGWRGTFLVAAGVILVVIAPIGWLLLNVAAGAPANTLKPTSNDGEASAKGFDALKQPVFWVLVAATLPVMLVLTSVSSSLASIVSDSGIARGRAAIVVSAFQISAAGGSLLGGWLSDRLGPRTIYAGILGAVAVVLAVMSQRPGLYAMSGAMVLLGLAGGSLMPWSGAAVMRRFGAQGFARVFGLLTAFFIPSTFAPILFGWIRDQTGAYQTAFLVFLVLLAPGALSLILLRPSPKPILAAAE